MTTSRDYWWTYLLRCSDNTFYTGATNDIPKRIEKHDNGKGAKYTRGRGPVTLVWARKFKTKSEALSEEYRVKKLSRQKKEELAPWWCYDRHLREKNILFQIFIEINAKYQSGTKCLMGPPSIRRELFDRLSRAVPTEEALRMLTSLSPIVEMGAGTGYWARLLTFLGADVVAYDNPSLVNLWHPSGTKHYEIQEGGPEVLRSHNDRTLFLCWPPADGDMAFDCLQNWSGSTLVYVGDFEGGTGNPKFYDALRAKFDLVKEVQIPQWAMLNDSLTVWKLRTS